MEPVVDNNLNDNLKDNLDNNLKDNLDDNLKDNLKDNSTNVDNNTNKNAKWYCYILRNLTEVHKNRTYNGFTNRPKNRLRQHNGELKGGARYTSKYGNKSWEMYVLITGFPNSQNALQCEWAIKHPIRGKRNRPAKYNNPEGRIRGLARVLKLNRWTNQSTIDNTFVMDVWIVKEYAHMLDGLRDSIRVHPVDKIDLDNI